MPRSLRHFPYKSTPDAAPDLPHLRNAIARIPQSNLPGDLKTRLQARARRMLDSAGGGGDGKTIDEADEWKAGAALAIAGFGYQLVDLADVVASELKAMVMLGEETKGLMRIRPEMRARIGTVAQQITQLVDWADTIDRGEDGKARVAWLKAQLALTEV